MDKDTPNQLTVRSLITIGSAGEIHAVVARSFVDEGGTSQLFSQGKPIFNFGAGGSLDHSMDLQVGATGVSAAATATNPQEWLW